MQVWANDLWISATENWQRIREAGLESQVFPVHAEAHELPYAEGFFDAVVSLDSYQYYGTDDLYLDYFHKFVKPGGMIGIVVPGLSREIDGPPPEHLTRPRPGLSGTGPGGATFWVDGCWCFHTAGWWARHWGRMSAMEGVAADYLADGIKDWIQYEKACDEAKTLLFPSEAETLEEDGGRYLALVRVVGRRRAEAP